jgi:hypothetical protein
MHVSERIPWAFPDLVARGVGTFNGDLGVCLVGEAKTLVKKGSLS